MLNILEKNKEIEYYYIIIDEAHERKIKIDIL